VRTKSKPSSAGTRLPDDGETLRRYLSDVVNEIHKLIELAPDEQTEALLRRQRSDYFALWEEVIKQDIDQRTPLYRDALRSLKAAAKAARAAKADIAKVAKAINQAAAAAKTVDKIVQLGIKSLI
jgi:hypothetical protein